MRQGREAKVERVKAGANQLLRVEQAMQGDSNTIGHSEEKDSPHYRRVWTRIVVALLAVSLIPLTVIGGGMYYYATSIITQRTLECLRLEVIDHEKAIDQFLAERTKDLMLLAKTMSLTSLTQPGVLESLVQELGCFIDLGVIDDKGQHLAYNGPYDLISRNYRDAEWFKAVMSNGVYISDVFLGFRNVPHFVIAVRQVSNHTVWILRATIDTAYFNTIVSEVLGKRAGDAYLVNRDGIFQSEPRTSGQLMGQSEFNNLEYFKGVKLEERKGQLCATTWLEKVPWLCVVKLDKDEIFTELHRVRNVGIAVFVLGGILIVFTVLLTTNFLVSRLEIKRRDILVLDHQLRYTSKMAASMHLMSGFVREISDVMATVDSTARWLQDLIQDGAPTERNTHEIMEGLNQIKAGIMRSRKVTDRILSVTRPTVPVIKEMQINDVLNDVLELMDRELQLNTIRVTRDYDEHLPLIHSDPPQLRQVFQNVLAHIVSSIPRDGEIVVSTRRRMGGVTVTVTDNGPGIPKEQLEKILDPFLTYRHEATEAGLGLSISVSILERLGALISVQSEPGKGTSYIVELPFYAKSPGS